MFVIGCTCQLLMNEYAAINLVSTIVPPRQAAVKILSAYSSVRSALDSSQFVDNYLYCIVLFGKQNVYIAFYFHISSIASILFRN